MITTVVDDSKKKSVKNNGRAASKAKELERRKADIALDKRGIPSGVAVGGDKTEEKLVDLLSKNRIEQMMQKKFVLSRDEFDLQMTYKSDEIKDIIEELKMLDSDEVEERKSLKKRWNELKDEKKDLQDLHDIH